MTVLPPLPPFAPPDSAEPELPPFSAPPPEKPPLDAPAFDEPPFPEPALESPAVPVPALAASPLLPPEAVPVLPLAFTPPPFAWLALPPAPVDAEPAAALENSPLFGGLPHAALPNSKAATTGKPNRLKSNITNFLSAGPGSEPRHGEANEPAKLHGLTTELVSASARAQASVPEYARAAAENLANLREKTNIFQLGSLPFRRAASVLVPATACAFGSGAHPLGP